MIVFNNGALGFIELEQKSTGLLGSEFDHPNFAATAEAAGIDEIRTCLPLSGEMAKHFSLSMVKTIMNGRVDEIVDLAHTNLWR